MARKKYYVFFIIAAAFIWSVDGLFRRSLHMIPPSFIVFLEHVIRVLIISPLIPRFLPEYKKLSKRDWTILIILGITSGALATTMYTAALAQIQNISYSVVALLQQTQPIFTIILAALILKEKITRRFSFFAIIALTASYFLAFPNFTPTIIGKQAEIAAAALAVGAAFFWGTGTILSKLILKKISYAATAIIRFIIVIPVTFIFSLFSNQTYPISNITSTQWFTLAALALFSGVVCFIIYYKGLQHTEAKISTIAEFTWPLSAAFMGFFFLGERLSSFQILAGAILLADILILSLTSPEKV